MPYNLRPFKIQVPDDVLSDLTARLDMTRWPDQVANSDWAYGTELGYLRELVAYWRHGYDWRGHEAKLNALPQYTADIDGQLIHFFHIKGKGPNPLPLILTHGWPSSVVEPLELVSQLTDPASMDGHEADSFDVVIPSMPGFGFSAAPLEKGQARVDIMWRKLMTDVLGYADFVAHGTDVGARVTSALGRFHADVVRAIHIGSVDLEWPSPVPVTGLSDAEQRYMEKAEGWEALEGGYAHQQSTRPQSLAYGLNDSPVGLAAWIVEKYRAWSDCDGDIESRFSKDQLLTNIMIYWVTRSIGPSMRRYYEVRNHPAYPKLAPGERIEVPTGIAMFPGEKELVVPREWADRCYNITHWTDMPRGGHFPAIEEPGLLVADLRRYFRIFR